MFATLAKYIQGCVSIWFSIDAKLDKIQPLLIQKVITNLSKATRISILQRFKKKKLIARRLNCLDEEKKVCLFITFNNRDLLFCKCL